MRVLITGGKGGTGKTLIASNLAYLASLRGLSTLLVDADIGNPNTWITLGAPKPKPVTTVYSFRPVIDKNKCNLCGKCVEVCPTHALVLIPNKDLLLIDTLCEGCSLCMYACPLKAIREGSNIAGWILRTKLKSLPIIIGELRPGERREDTVITELLRQCENLEVNIKIKLTFIDAPAGTSALIKKLVKFSRKYLCVVEPTPLSLNDFMRLTKVIELDKTVVVLNKTGMSPMIENRFRSILRKLRVKWVEIPFLRDIASSYLNSIPLPDSPIWSKLSSEFLEILKMIL